MRLAALVAVVTSNPNISDERRGYRRALFVLLRAYILPVKYRLDVHGCRRALRRTRRAYVVGVNLTDSVAYVPYPRTMYVDAAGEPEIVRVEAGQHVGLSGWTLGPELARLGFASGSWTRRGARCRGIPSSCTTSRIRRFPNSSGMSWADTAPSGLVEFDIRQGRRYVIQGRKDRSGVAPQTRIFTAADAPAVALVLAWPAK